MGERSAQRPQLATFGACGRTCGIQGGIHFSVRGLEGKEAPADGVIVARDFKAPYEATFQVPTGAQVHTNTAAVGSGPSGMRSTILPAGADSNSRSGAATPR